MRSPAEIARERARLNAVVGAKVKKDGTAASIKGFRDRCEARAVHDAQNKRRKLEMQVKQQTRGTPKIVRFLEKVKQEGKAPPVGVVAPGVCAHGNGRECAECARASLTGVVMVEGRAYFKQ